MDRRGFLKTGSIAMAGLASGAQAEARPACKPIGNSGTQYLILACDGGGMRGYLSSLIMQRLSQELNIFGANNSGIDLYAGTSTGGLIALGLAFGKSIDSVVSLYQNDGAEIFNPLPPQPLCFLSTPAPLGAANGSTDELVQVKFDDIGKTSVRSVIENFIPGNPALHALPNRVMVTTFGLGAENGAWSPLVIDNLPDGQGRTTQLYDAALSTSAAPFYFPPYLHPVFGWCSDGGLFANNPAPQAVSRAIENGVALTNISLLSIGTGAVAASLPVTKATRLCYGLNKWASLDQSGPTPPLPILNAVIDGVAATNDYMCGQLLGDRYLRINPLLPRAVALDDYSPATMQMFETTATDFFNSAKWTAVTSWIKTYFQS